MLSVLEQWLLHDPNNEDHHGPLNTLSTIPRPCGLYEKTILLSSFVSYGIRISYVTSKCFRDGEARVMQGQCTTYQWELTS